MKYKPRIDREKDRQMRGLLEGKRGCTAERRMAFYRSTLVRILATIRISAPQMRVAI